MVDQAESGLWGLGPTIVRLLFPTQRELMASQRVGSDGGVGGGLHQRIDIPSPDYNMPPVRVNAIISQNPRAQKTKNTAHISL